MRRGEREQLEYPVARLGLARAVRAEGGVQHELDERRLLQRREGRRLGLGGVPAVRLLRSRARVRVRARVRARVRMRVRVRVRVSGHSEGEV